MPESYSKLEGVMHNDDLDQNEQVGLIIKVIPAGYLPDGAVVRAQISPNMFTCIMPRYFLANLENDKNVRSFSINQPLFSN